MTINEIIKQIEDRPKAEIQLIKRAYEFAQQAHQGQKRKSGQDYIQHPLATAFFLAKMNLDSPTIAGGLLHDVDENTPRTLADIEKEFGSEIAFFVGGITKVGKIKYRGEESQIETLRKMFLALAEDIRVVLIKLADRLHNMQTLQYLDRNKQKRIALETLEIYAPLAHRLGIGELKGELEDLAFPYIFPKEYKELVKNVKEKFQQRKEYLKKVKNVLEKELKKEGIKPLGIHARVKHYYSLYKKLQRYDMDLNKIYDLVALRIIVEKIEECYEALGIIHKMWRPLLGKIKDYISMPKPNGYQSLHTTVFCLDGKITEFQIRTAKMHEEAEYGIASHWAYDEAGKPNSGVTPNLKQLVWVNQLRDWQKEIGKNPQEFIEGLKIDFLKDRIFVFTPKGEVKDLPEGATPIDFAYAVHTDIGHRCKGAKVDGRMVSLDYRLKNGEMVEILVTKNIKKPSRDWLNFAKTSQAKTRIRSQLKKS